MCVPRVLLTYNTPSRFVHIDHELLAERYDVTARYVRRPRDLRPWSVRRDVLRHDLSFCWFASWHSFWPCYWARRLGKPSVVVSGGYDVANEPAIGYGSQRGGIRRVLSRSVLRWTNVVVTFSDSATREAVANAGVGARKIRRIYQGLAEPALRPAVGRQPIAMTTGNVSQENLWRKGLLPFVRTASLVPECEFWVVGGHVDRGAAVLQDEAGGNVRLLGRLSNAELDAAYACASVYVQASVHEGFGMSVAEAMLFGCIPVVTRAGSLPEVVGPWGHFSASQEPAELAAAIRAALAAGPEARHGAREYVISNFSLYQRRVALHELIDGLTSGCRPV